MSEYAIPGERPVALPKKAFVLKQADPQPQPPGCTLLNHKADVQAQLDRFEKADGNPSNQDIQRLDDPKTYTSATNLKAIQATHYYDQGVIEVETKQTIS